jgi:cytoskeletal protein RodZ
MEGMNKIISLFLGLVVVMVLFAIITGRFTPFKSKNLSSTATKISGTPTPTPAGQKKFLGLFNIGSTKPTVTPTPTKATVVVDTTTTGSYTNTATNTSNGTYINPTTNQVGSIKTIPATGSPTELLPLFGSALLAGVYLRRKTKV